VESTPRFWYDVTQKGSVMDLRADFELQEELLLVTASGELTLDAALRLLKQLFDTANEKGVDRILVDCLAMSGELSTSDRYDLGAKAAAYSQREKSNKKLAIVGLPPTINGFAVEVAQNRGLATAAFTSKPDAMAWLDAFRIGMRKPWLADMEK
jgi:anti-anti-sigma regulatory factor